MRKEARARQLPARQRPTRGFAPIECGPILDFIIGRLFQSVAGGARCVPKTGSACSGSWLPLHWQLASKMAKGFGGQTLPVETESSLARSFCIAGGPRELCNAGWGAGSPHTKAPRRT